MPNQRRGISSLRWSNIRAVRKCGAWMSFEVRLTQNRVDGGHYIAVRRTPQGWYQCKDHKVTKLQKDSDKWTDNHQDGVLFFFKRIDS